MKLPQRGRACAGSQATATRIRLRLPMMLLVGSKSTQPAPGNLQPSVGRPAADSGCAVCVWHKDVTAYEAGREAKRSDTFDHERRKVATGSATALKRLAWGLHVPLDAA